MGSSRLEFLMGFLFSIFFILSIGGGGTETFWNFPGFFTDFFDQFLRPYFLN